MAAVADVAQVQTRAVVAAWDETLEIRTGAAGLEADIDLPVTPETV